MPLEMGGMLSLLQPFIPLAHPVLLLTGITGDDED